MVDARRPRVPAGTPTAAEMARRAIAERGGAREGQAPAVEGRGEGELSDARKASLAAAAARGEAAPEPGIVDLDGEEESDGEAGDEHADMNAPLPPWAVLPDGFEMPRGWVVWAILIRGELTNSPKGGDRWCLLWNLTEGDQKRAAKRARGDVGRVIDEMAKGTIRLVGTVADEDRGIEGTGFRSDWGGKLSEPGSVDAFWNAIGAKYQHAIKSLYLKNHTFSAAEQADFFEHCVLPRSVG